MGRIIIQLLLLPFLAFQLLLGSPAQGLVYRHEKLHKESGQPLSIHILEVDPDGICMRPVRALNNGLGRETVSSMARRSGALAAVNGGFFRIGGRHDGLPAGILKIGQDWYGGSASLRGALGWRLGGGPPLIEPLLIHWELRVEGAALPLTGLNLPRSKDAAVLYTWAYHRSSLTDPGGFEAQIQDGQVIALGNGDSPIPMHGFVYSEGPSRSTADDRLKVGQKVKIQTRFEPQGRSGSQGDSAVWRQMDFIVGGAGVLLRAGEPVSEFAPEQMAKGFIENAHPRTAIGWRPDGTWIVVVADGRQPSISAGMTLPELSRYMHSLGCNQALNLDGGGSSTFYFQGKVRNSPSDFGKERPVSDSIVFIEKATDTPCG